MSGEYLLAPQVLPGLGGIPLKFEVILTPSEELQSLRQQLRDMTSQRDALDAKYKRAEYLYRVETLINLQLQDLCKEQGVKIPPRLFQRPDSSF